jgi:two-component system cell cycle sensor histidine kinase/response regulator CckA
MNSASKSSHFRGAAADRPCGVLAVDDEPMIRQFLSLMLPYAGCKVFMAESAGEALKIANGEDGHEIDLLVTDLWMPGMSGTELATELQVTRPGMKTLIISGDTGENIAAAAIGLPDSAWLPKPFQFAALCTAIRGLFETEEAASRSHHTAVPAGCA